MNFLAHQHLSFNNVNLAVGNFIADFLRGKELKELDDKVKEGIKLHRFIDDYTDSHPLIEKSLAILKPYQGRYRSVVLDVYYDYFLAKNWHLYEKDPLLTFSQNRYKEFKEVKHLFPRKTHLALNSLLENDWLTNYGNEVGLTHAFANVSKRITFNNKLNNAVGDIDEITPLLEPLFLEFYPQLLKESQFYIESLEL